jgi:Galactose oxidase, central domain
MKRRTFGATVFAALLLLASTCFAAELPANTWTKLSDGGIGPKFSPAMVYSPKLKRFVMIGGAIGRYPKGGPFPYDVLSAAPGSGEWRNEFPEGSGWKPKVGPAKVPAWKGYRFATKDVKGNVRPHMRHTKMYYQYCLDTDQNCVWAIIGDRTMRLDLATMKWEDLGRYPAGAKVVAQGAPRSLMWASMCYDPLNKEVVLFGGGHQGAQPEGGTWLFSTEKRVWRKLEKKDPVRDPLRADTGKLRDQVKDLVAAIRNRLYRTELASASKIDLGGRLRKLLAEVKALVARLEEAKLVVGVDRASIARAEAAAGKAITEETLRLVFGVESFLSRTRDALAVQPPPRIMAPMVYDAGAGKIVMFGGDQWERMNCETWTYDCKTRSWARKRPALNPSPRGGHALVYLPKSKKVLLFGGYVYRTSMSYCTSLYQPLKPEMWIYDTAKNEWRMIKNAGSARPALSCVGRAPVAVAAAASASDLVQVVGLGKKLSTWAIRVEPGLAVAGAGSKPFDELTRGLCFDPAWFDESLKTVKPGEAAAKLKALASNKWVSMRPPKRLFNRDWGTQIFDFHRDQIMHWSGGHSAYCGTAPAHYSVKLNCWSTGFAAAIPMEHCYSSGVAATWPASTFKGRPFAPHTYKSYCYDARTRKLVWLHGKTWIYDPDRREWESNPKKPPFYAERHTTVACSTPHGIAAWAVPAGKSVYTGWRGLWLMTDTAKGEWKNLVKSGKTAIFPIAYGDRHGMCYDSKRDRLYMFHFGLKGKHKIAVYDFKTAKAEVIEPKGAKGFPAGASVGREPVYVPGQDVVFIASRAKGGPVTLLFDPATNAWLSMSPKFDKDKRGRAVRPGHGVGTGVMWDPGRKLLWASDARGSIFAMKFDRKTAGAKALE